ncbi:uncharacterized protein DUF1735 [Dyadobacter jejuensis]|uniref:Uncharacterized protein DUF1735 n=1 Tax=Dyadobacter jejuensis TaxID=1082580 RepID=A0A316AI19_9BACT|nr:DUF5627 domain-containing protein [Dyadobacter jejuensis]PWJ56928.1 uncharacterized protein DUF1735 [Dyadobacter jejuensis]
MKHISLFLLLCLGFLACKNGDIVHPDFDYTAGYFPYQYPVRTLILGDDIYDNSNDNAHKFIISAAIGGVYKNDRDRKFEIVVDESLCQGALFDSNGDTIRALPQQYYTLSPDNSLVIPKDKYNGGVEVQLTEAFFNDPNAFKLSYVVPVRMVGSTDVDSIISGKSELASPDRRKPENWVVAPKDFTLFAIKYINEYHGNYFFEGESTVLDSTGALIETKTYKQSNMVQNGVTLLTTSGRHQVAYNTSFQSSEISGDLPLLLDFDNGKCTVSSADDQYTVTGTGTFNKGTYEWGNKSRNGIEIEYTITVDNKTYSAKELLVARDRAVVMELFNPVIL